MQRIPQEADDPKETGTPEPPPLDNVARPASPPRVQEEETLFFTPEGEVNAACFDGGAFRALIATTQEIQSLGDKKVETFHLFMSLTRGQYFESLFGRITGHQGVKQVLALKLLRALVRQTYHRSIVGEGSPVNELHLLRAILAEREGPTAKVLSDCGIDLDRLRASWRLN